MLSARLGHQQQELPSLGGLQSAVKYYDRERENSYIFSTNLSSDFFS